MKVAYSIAFPIHFALAILYDQHSLILSIRNANNISLVGRIVALSSNVFKQVYTYKHIVLDLVELIASPRH